MDSQGGAAAETIEKPRAIDFTTVKFPINNFIDYASTDGKKLHNYRWPAKQNGETPRAVVAML